MGWMGTADLGAAALLAVKAAGSYVGNLVVPHHPRSCCPNARVGQRMNRRKNSSCLLMSLVLLFPLDVTDDMYLTDMQRLSQ
jgi:hypothetical protein